MELEESKQRFERMGLGVAAISYDSPSVLSHAAKRLNISIPLLSDEGSSIIRAFDILNTNIAEGHSWHGIPFPGTYIVDENGIVASKYFEQYHRQRSTVNTILSKEYGVSGGSRTVVETNHLTLRVSSTEDVASRGNRVMLMVEVEPRPKMHVYSPEVQGYHPVVFSIEENPSLMIHEALFPEPEYLNLPAIKETVPVYQDRFTVTRDVTISPKFRDPNLDIPAIFEYQACDDRVCYPPTKVTLKFSFQLKNHDQQRVPEEMRKPRSR